MKVLLLGAPGSGKTDISKRLARALNRDKSGHHWTVIDGYVEELTKRTGIHYGFEADYPHNAQIMTQRWLLEAEALNRGDATITCGSIYETIIYAALIDMIPPADEAEMTLRMRYASTCMQFFGDMAISTFNYNALFYLPFEHDHEKDWHAVIDAKIPEVVAGYGYTLRALEGTPRQKVANALEILRDIRDRFEPKLEASPPDEQSGV